MPAEIVNLRRARKAKARVERDKQADLHRSAYGRTKAEKTASKAQTDAAARKLDGHRRPPEKS